MQSPDRGFYWRLYRPGTGLERSAGSSARMRADQRSRFSEGQSRDLGSSLPERASSSGGNGDSAAVSKLLCPTDSSHRLIRASLSNDDWPKNWPSLYPSRTSNFSTPSSSRSVVGIFCLSMPAFDPAFPFGSRGKKIYFGFVRSFSPVISGSRNLSCMDIHRFARPMSDQIGLILTRARSRPDA